MSAPSDTVPPGTPVPDAPRPDRWRRSPALAGPGGHRRRPADDRARRLHREHRPPRRRRRPGHQRREHPVGRHRLHPDLRRAAAARRPGGRLHGPQAGLPHRAARASPPPPASAGSPPTRSCSSRPAPCRAGSPHCSRRRRCPCSRSPSPSPKERARAFAVFGAVSGGGAAIGLLLGGALTEYASWRWTLGVNVPIAIATALPPSSWSGRAGRPATGTSTSPACCCPPPGWSAWSTASARPPRRAWAGATR